MNSNTQTATKIISIDVTPKEAEILKTALAAYRVTVREFNMDAVDEGHDYPGLTIAIEETDGLFYRLCDAASGRAK